ncbi:MAG: metallophosphoesterase [Candidatus Omnitrophota bacterium]
MKLNIAVLSDLHCSTSPGESFLDCSVSTLPDPVCKLISLIKSQGLSAEILLICGDISNKADTSGTKYAWKQIYEIKKALKARHLIATLGNHDVSRKRSTSSPFRGVKSLKDFPVKSSNARKSYWGEHFCFEEKNNFRILVLNSAYDHGASIERDHGKIDHGALDAIEKFLNGRPKKYFQIAIMHHHPIAHDIPYVTRNDLMLNGDTLISLLEKINFDIVIHGHKHYPRLRYAPGGYSALPIFASGSFSKIFDPVMSLITRNVFHLLAINKKNITDRVAGTISTWEYGLTSWEPTTKRSAGFPAITGFGCRDPRLLSQQIGCWFNKRKGVGISWELLSRKFPSVNNLIPKDFLEFEKFLDKQKLKILFGRNDVPEAIGRRGV